MSRSRYPNRFGQLPDNPFFTVALPAGRTTPAIYAVTMADRPGVVKVGQTHKWSRRKSSYQPIQTASVYQIQEEVGDLLEIERQVLAAIPCPIHFGNEWFRGEIEQAQSAIEGVLAAWGILFERVDITG